MKVNSRKHEWREVRGSPVFLLFKDLWGKRFTFRGVEDAVGLGVAHITSLGLAVMLKSTDLTKIVSAPGGQGTRLHVSTESWRGKSGKTGVLLCYDGILEGVPADEALKGQIFIITAHLVVLIVYIKAQHCSGDRRRHMYSIWKPPCPELTIGSISALFQLPLNLPAMFVVRSVVKELAAVWWQERRTWTLEN